MKHLWTSRRTWTQKDWSLWSILVLLVKSMTTVQCLCPQGRAQHNLQGTKVISMQSGLLLFVNCKWLLKFLIISSFELRNWMIALSADFAFKSPRHMADIGTLCQNEQILDSLSLPPPAMTPKTGIKILNLDTKCCFNFSWYNSVQVRQSKSKFPKDQTSNNSQIWTWLVYYILIERYLESHCCPASITLKYQKKVYSYLATELLGNWNIGNCIADELTSFGSLSLYKPNSALRGFRIPEARGVPKVLDFDDNRDSQSDGEMYMDRLLSDCQGRPLRNWMRYSSIELSFADLAIRPTFLLHVLIAYCMNLKKVTSFVNLYTSVIQIPTHSSIEGVPSLQFLWQSAWLTIKDNYLGKSSDLRASDCFRWWGYLASLQRFRRAFFKVFWIDRARQMCRNARQLYTCMWRCIPCRFPKTSKWVLAS